MNQHASAPIGTLLRVLLLAGAVAFLGCGSVAKRPSDGGSGTGGAISADGSTGSGGVPGTGGGGGVVVTGAGGGAGAAGVGGMGGAGPCIVGSSRVDNCVLQ